MTLVLSVLEQGMIYAIMALGIYITYTILDFPDLTVDGSFPLGAALSAVLISKGMNPVLTLVIAFAAGAVAGTNDFDYTFVHAHRCHDRFVITNRTKQITGLGIHIPVQ